MDKLPYVCKQCESIAYAESFQEIVDNEKLCVICIKNNKSDIRSELAKKKFLKKEAYICNNCNYIDTKSFFVKNIGKAGIKILCPKCSSTDYKIVKGGVE